jgi:RHS repeat-associated protein
MHELSSQKGLRTWYWDAELRTPLAVDDVAGRRYVVSDHIGTPTHLYDELGRLTWNAEIDAGGRFHLIEGQVEECPWRWPGQYDDGETALWYNHYRYFDPQTCSYISQDPLGLAGGLNPYAYVSDPTIAIDPLGLAQCVHQPSGNPLVDAFNSELDAAVQAARHAVDGGSVVNPCARLFQQLRHVPGMTWLANMVRGTAIQQIAEDTVRHGPAATAIRNAGGDVIFNRASILGHGRPGTPLRPDVQIVVPHPTLPGPTRVHMVDITTAAQAAGGKINKYSHPAVGGMTDITY